MNIFEEHDELATPSDAVREWRYNAGAQRADQAWILSDYDTWEANPHYVGEPVPHPEWEHVDAFTSHNPPLPAPAAQPVEQPVDDGSPF